MDRRISPSFVKETALAIQIVEIVQVRLASKEWEVANFEVVVENTKVLSERGAIVVRDESDGVGGSGFVFARV